MRHPVPRGPSAMAGRVIAAARKRKGTKVDDKAGLNFQFQFSKTGSIRMDMNMARVDKKEMPSEDQWIKEGNNFPPALSCTHVRDVDGLGPSWPGPRPLSLRRTPPPTLLGLEREVVLNENPLLVERQRVAASLVADARQSREALLWNVLLCALRRREGCGC